MEEDLRSLGVKGWRDRALGRREWAAIVKEARAELKRCNATGTRGGGGGGGGGG